MKAVLDTIESDSLFRVIHKQNVSLFVAAASHYCSYIEERCKNGFPIRHPIVETKAITDENGAKSANDSLAGQKNGKGEAEHSLCLGVAETKPVSTENTTEKPAPSEKTENPFNERLYDLLKAICAVNPNGVTLKSLSKCLKVSETSIKQILTKVCWARYQSGKYVFIGTKAQKRAQKPKQHDPRYCSETKTINGDSIENPKAESDAGYPISGKASGTKKTHFNNAPKKITEKEIKTTNRTVLGSANRERDKNQPDTEALERRIYELVKAGYDGYHDGETISSLSHKLNMSENAIGAILIRANWVSYRSGRLRIIGEFSSNEYQQCKSREYHQFSSEQSIQSALNEPPESHQRESKMGNSPSISQNRKVNPTKNQTINHKPDKVVVPAFQKANRPSTTNENKQMTTECTYSDRFGLSPADFIDVDITTLPLSIRSIHCFKQNQIDTLADLLNVTPSRLLIMRNFGKKTLKEIEQYLSEVCNGAKKPSSDEIVNKASFFRYSDERDRSHHSGKPFFSETILNHIEALKHGDFYFAEHLSLSEGEQNTIIACKEAFAALDSELVAECFSRPEHIIPISNVFEEFVISNKLSFEIEQLLDQIPFQRRNKKAKGYIDAFTTLEEERNILNAQYESDARLCDIKKEKLIGMPDNEVNLCKRFLAWCLFDIEKEITELYDAVCKNDRIRAVIKGRAERKTLDEIGITHGVTRERVRQIEVKAKRIFARLYGKTRFMLKISAELDGSTIILPSAIARYCKEISSEVVFLLKSNQSAAYTYDPQLDVFIIGDDSIKSRINTLIENLPDIIKTQEVERIIAEAKETDDIPDEMMPYVFHPFHLAEQMKDELTTIVALLHDVVEDTHYTLDDLRGMGFPAEAIDALRLLTHDPAVPYMDYVAAIKPNPVARAVKLADLNHNSDLSRLDTIDEKALERVQKYHAAIALLESKRKIPPSPSVRKPMVFFWKDTEENGCFSNWYRRPFVIDGVQYPHVEQYMMSQKARLFHDEVRYAAILRTENPNDCKKLGKQVTPFDPKIWDGAKYEIVKAGNRAKFEQNPDLKAQLLATGTAILAEASPRDKIWGIGKTARTAAEVDPSEWPGKNLLGKILMELREEFAAHPTTAARQEM